ncbi:MAG: hypothetical protein RL065_1307 [Bacteroidota bacterium]|jgi:hypothetical protein
MHVRVFLLISFLLLSFINAFSNTIIKSTDFSFPTSIKLNHPCKFKSISFDKTNGYRVKWYFAGAKLNELSGDSVSISFFKNPIKVQVQVIGIYPKIDTSNKFEIPLNFEPSTNTSFSIIGKDRVYYDSTYKFSIDSTFDYYEWSLDKLNGGFVNGKYSHEVQLKFWMKEGKKFNDVILNFKGVRDGFVYQVSKKIRVISIPIVTIESLDSATTDEEIIFRVNDLNEYNKSKGEYLWHFGDGTTTSTNSNVMKHKYLHSGKYDVSVFVLNSDAGCCFVKQFKTVLIKNESIAYNNQKIDCSKFQINYDVYCDNSSIKLSASIDLKEGNDINYIWKLGNNIGIKSNGYFFTELEYHSYDSLNLSLSITQEGNKICELRKTISVAFPSIDEFEIKDTLICGYQPIEIKKQYENQFQIWTLKNTNFNSTQINTYCKYPNFDIPNNHNPSNSFILTHSNYNKLGCISSISKKINPNGKLEQGLKLRLIQSKNVVNFNDSVTILPMHDENYLILRRNIVKWNWLYTNSINFNEHFKNIIDPKKSIFQIVEDKFGCKSISEPFEPILSSD